MPYLIVLIIATALLVAWLLFAIASVALGDLPYPRLHMTVSRGSSSGAEATAGAGPIAPDLPSGVETVNPVEETVLYDEFEVERAVRERLYGGRGRRA